MPLQEAADVTKSSSRALLQFGFEKNLPVYAQVKDYGFFNIIEITEDAEGNQIKQRVLTDNDFPEFLDNPFNGRLLVNKGCLDGCARDPENAQILLEFHQHLTKADSKICVRHIFYGKPLNLQNTPLEVMVSDLKDVGLLPNDNLQNLTEFVDDPRWPHELDIAVMVWRAALSDHALEDRPREFIEKWLAENYPDLNKEQVLRISTMVNWNKSPGRKLSAST